jgi:hypothetical protein
MVLDVLNLKTPVPCVQGFFNERLVSYTTQVSPKQIMNLLGHDPRSNNWKRLPDEVRGIYEHLQRKTSKSRREGVAGYIEERLAPDALTIGAFPAISIAFQESTEFRPYGGAIPSAVGELLVDISPMNVRILIDGLGRITGALDLADEEGTEAILNNFMFPITIYAPRPGTKPLSWAEMGQLFHDYNFRVQQVSRPHAIALDISDIYISLALRLGECPVIASNGGVAERAASLGSKSTELVVQTVLVRTVRGACEGRKFQESNLASVDNPNLTRSSFNTILASLDDFYSGIAQRMGQARFTDRQNIHLTSSGWQALGVIHHDIAFKLKLDAVDRAKVLEKIAAIDWGRGNPDWLALAVGHPEIDKKTGQPVRDAAGRPKIAFTGAGRTTTQKLIDYIREKAGIAAALKGMTNEDDENLAA